MRPHRDSPCSAKEPKRSSSQKEPTGESGGRSGGAQGVPAPHAEVLPRAVQQRLTWPRRIRQPLGRSHQAPLEKFPNFFAALHAFASGKSNESQKEETATARSPGRSVHHRCVLLTPVSAVDPTFPARPPLQTLENVRKSNLPRGDVRGWAFRGGSGTRAAPAST